METRTAILAIVDEIMAQSRLETAARASGWSLSFPSSIEDFWSQARANRPDLILVGLAATRLPWEEMVTSLRRDPRLSDVPVVGFGPHHDLQLRQRALDAGCDRVVANSAVATDLVGVVGAVRARRVGQIGSE